MGACECIFIEYGKTLRTDCSKNPLTNSPIKYNYHAELCNVAGVGIDWKSIFALLANEFTSPLALAGKVYAHALSLSRFLSLLQVIVCQSMYPSFYMHTGGHRLSPALSLSLACDMNRKLPWFKLIA